MTNTAEASPFRPIVTVVIPLYNYRDQVGRAIDSVKEQTLTNFECFIVDDGSTDDPEPIVLSKIDNDSRFKYIRQNNQGVAHARNNGIAAGSAPYICCLDADDKIAPTFLEVCVTALRKHSSLGIAYTGLYFIKPDGSEGLSPWPEGYDYNRQLKRQNQIPTCCVYRREMWKRLGGYRQRYAPGGAGAEDAEFFLRAGAYGWGGMKVTEEGLFIYSWMSGRVSGNPSYKETDWLALHPWTQDEQHPFMSLAKPKHFSHPVRQYDEPGVSVVIPVGMNHVGEVYNALDSLESQTFRRWEAIVVYDDATFTDQRLKDAYPYARFLNTSGNLGAGAARNVGVAAARAPLILFLDADDWLYPDAIESMVDARNFSDAIIYTDYVGKAFMDRESAAKLGERLLRYDEKTGEAVIRHYSANYDYDKAIRQPNKEMFIWNLITSLVPKAWHNEIGGFDETMKSWEDWDYWIRLARAGKCFERVPRELIVYRFYSGERREHGLKSAKNLIKYMIDKYKEGTIMPCNCGSNKPPVNPIISFAQPAKQTSSPSGGTVSVNDSDIVLVTYDSPNRGQHRVIGPSTKRDYGYRGGGAKFYVHRDDVAVMPHIFKPVVAEQKVAVRQEPAPPPAPPTPTSETKPEEATFDTRDDLQNIPGISATLAQELNAAGIMDARDILDAGVDELVKVKGIGQRRAETILAWLNSQNEPV